MIRNQNECTDSLLQFRIYDKQYELTISVIRFAGTDSANIIN